MLDKRAHFIPAYHLPAETLKEKHAAHNDADGSKFNSALYGIYNRNFHTLVRLLKH